MTTIPDITIAPSYAKGGYITSSVSNHINWVHAGTVSSIDFNGGYDSTVTIDSKELSELKDDSKLLYALIDAGVEDWEGFNEAVAIWREGGE